MENIQITKSIRFKLESSNQNNLINDTINKLNTNKGFDLENFKNELKNYIDNLEKFLFYKKKNGETHIKTHIILKKEWLQAYAKQEFFECKTADKAFTINNCDLSQKISENKNNIRTLYKELSDYSGRKLHEQARRSGIALLLNRLNSKYYLPFFVDLVQSSQDKKEKNNLSLRLKSDGKELINSLKTGIESFLPEQSAGMCIAKASFNYYTIDKKEITWKKVEDEIKYKLKTSIEDCIRNFKTSIERKYSNKSNNKKKEGNKIIENFKNIEQYICEEVHNSSNLPLYLGDSPFLGSQPYASLRQILKNIKATQKAKFNEHMYKNIPYNQDDLKELYLFKNIKEDEYTKYLALTNEIKKLSDEKNQTSDEKHTNTLTSKIENKAKERGELLKTFKEYTVFASFYKDIALSHGKLLAKMLAIEKEKVESQLLGYWAVMMECEGKHKVVLIPRGEKAKKFKKRLEESINPKEEVKLYWFESFTYRSLQKLCFGNLETNTNTFYPELRKDRALFRKFSSEDRNGYLKFISGEHEFKGDELKKIDFYQSVLASDCAKNKLNLPYDEVYNNVVNKQFDNLEDFKIALERVCYKRCITTNKHLIDNLVSEFDAQIFDITSLDLRREENTKDKAEKYAYKEKRPTLLWREFWKEENEENDWNVRLNPEISIIYRKPKESRIEKYGSDSKKNNRYLQEQFTLVMTFNEHCNAPTKNLAFADITKEEEVIKEFNERFKKENIRFALGIDNGEVELSTLGVYFPEFEKATNKDKIKELSNVERYGFDTLTIKDLGYKETDKNGNDKEIYKNVSYFLKEDLYCRTFGKTHEDYEAMFEKVFEKKRLLSLDLSAAKLVCGHIVTNGDVKALYNLWLKHAQRNIYDMNFTI